MRRLCGLLIVLICTLAPAAFAQLPLLDTLSRDPTDDQAYGELPWDSIDPATLPTPCNPGYCVQGIDPVSHQFDCQPCASVLTPTPVLTTTPYPTLTVTATPTPTLTPTPSATASRTPATCATPEVMYGIDENLAPLCTTCAGTGVPLLVLGSDYVFFDDGGTDKLIYYTGS